MVVPRTQRRSAYDIELDGVGMKLLDAIDIRPDPGSEPPPDAIYRDFSAGAGLPYGPDGYGWIDGSESSDDPAGPWPGGDCRSGVFMPSGKIHKLNILVPHADAAVRSIVNFQGSLFFFGGRYPIAVSNGTSPNGSFTADFGAGVTANHINAATVFNGQIVVGLDGAGLGSVATTTDGVTWPISSLGFNAVKTNHVFWDSGGVGAERLIVQATTNSIRTCSGDPTVGANYSAAITVPSMASGGINSMPCSAKHLYLCGPAGVFDIDSRGHASNLVPDFAQSYIIGNGGASIIHDGDLHVNAGNGIRRIPLGGARVDEPEQYQPGIESADSGSPIWGYASLPSVVNGWLVWPIWNPSKNRTYIMLAKDKRLLGKDVPGPMVWHGSLGTFPGIVTATLVNSPSSGGETRLWCATEGPNEIYWMTMPFSGNPYQEYVHGGTTHQWGEHTSMYVGPRWERPATKIIPLGYNIESENTDGGSRVSVFRRNDKEVDSSDEPVWARKAVAQNGAYVSPRDLGNESFSTIDFRYDLDGTETEPAILRSVRIEADVNVIQRIWRKYTAVIMSPQVTARGTKQRRSIRSVIRGLRQLEGINATPVQFIDEDGEEARVRMIPSMIEQKRKTRNGKWEHVVTFVLETLNRRIRWTTGERWDQTDQWGAA